MSTNKNTVAGGSRKTAKSGKRILYAASEALPYIAAGSLGHIAGSLPKFVKHISNNADIRIVIPLYSEIQARFSSELELVGTTRVRLSWRDLYCGVYKSVLNGVTFYFIENKYYFDRENCYGYYDDGERFAFFSKAVIAVMEVADFIPDILHVIGWQVSLVPVYLKTRFAGRYDSIRTVLTINDIETQGVYQSDIMSDIFDIYPDEGWILMLNGSLNLTKGGVIASDRVTTVSQSCLDEIRSQGGAYGLEPVIAEYGYKIKGITNGIDNSIHNPETDPLLAMNYGISSIEEKAVNKRELQKLFRLPIAPDTMLICVISKLLPRKGMDILSPIVDELIKLDTQFLLLGTGEHRYELFFSEMSLRYPDHISVNIAYNPEIASKVYAGADVILMPSKQERSAMNQMIACRYGTIPIAHAAGVLKDTVTDCRAGEGNGFIFNEYNPLLLLDTIKKANELYRWHKEDWRNLMREAMSRDYSWTRSAGEYIALYNDMR